MSHLVLGSYQKKRTLKHKRVASNPADHSAELETRPRTRRRLDVANRSDSEAGVLTCMARRGRGLGWLGRRRSRLWLKLGVRKACPRRARLDLEDVAVIAIEQVHILVEARVSLVLVRAARERLDQAGPERRAAKRVEPADDETKEEQAPKPASGAQKPRRRALAAGITPGALLAERALAVRGARASAAGKVTRSIHAGGVAVALHDTLRVADETLCAIVAAQASIARLASAGPASNLAAVAASRGEGLDRDAPTVHRVMGRVEGQLHVVAARALPDLLQDGVRNLRMARLLEALGACLAGQVAHHAGCLGSSLAGLIVGGLVHADTEVVVHGRDLAGGSLSELTEVVAWALRVVASVPAHALAIADAALFSVGLAPCIPARTARVAAVVWEAHDLAIRRSPLLLAVAAIVSEREEAGPANAALRAVVHEVHDMACDRVVKVGLFRDIAVALGDGSGAASLLDRRLARDALAILEADAQVVGLLARHLGVAVGGVAGRVGAVRSSGALEVLHTVCPAVDHLHDAVGDPCVVVLVEAGKAVRLWDVADHAGDANGVCALLVELLDVASACEADTKVVVFRGDSLRAMEVVRGQCCLRRLIAQLFKVGARALGTVLDDLEDVLANLVVRVELE
mmetsp:Transcript_23952/g.67982  ORF Transcript_23952/g.67982 Transcript_23952/m.67982 type:complete len:631 (+) Transcript_23952:22-1914(+)